ncbi:hypothetical protein ScPMuIL_006208 [Solemya velum]
MFAPVAIKTVGCKKVITGTWLCHLIYIGTNFYPRWWTLIPSSILVGSTTGFLWTAQGVYLTQFSFSLSERTGIDRGVALARLNGIFFSIFYVTSFSGNIIASTVMFQSSQNETLVNFSDACGVNSCPGNGEDISFGRTNTRLVFIILGVFLVCEAIGVLLTIFALPEMDASLHMKSKPLAASMVACLQGLWDTRQLLLLPAVVFYSLADGVIWADYTKAFVSCPLGIQTVGFVMAVKGATSTVSAVFMSRISKYTGRQAIIATAIILNTGTLSILLFWNPRSEDVVYIYIIAGVCGVAGTIWHVQMNVIVAVMFPERQEPSFALLHGLKAIEIKFKVYFVTNRRHFWIKAWGKFVKPGKSTKMTKCVEEKEIQSTWVLTIAFLFVFSSFMSIQNLQSSLNEEDGLGTASLAAIYGACILSCTLAPAAIKIIGCKKVIIATWLFHLIYMGTNFYPRWWTLIPSSILVGSTSGFLWTSQGVYLTQFSFSLSERTGVDRSVTLNRLNNIFYSIFQMSGLPGNIIASTVLFQGSQNQTFDDSNDVCGIGSCPGNMGKQNLVGTNTGLVYILLGVFSVCEIIGLLLTILAVPAMDASSHMRSKSVKTSLVSCLNGLSDMRLLMLTPVMFCMALIEGLLWADYTKAFVSCPLGIQVVGFVMAVYSLTSSVASVFMSRISKYTGRQAILATAFILNAGTLCILLFWQPRPEDVVYIYVIAGVWGVAGNIWLVQLNVIVAVMFPEKQEPSFALLHGLKAIGYTLSFVLSTTVCVSVKIYITLGVLIIAAVSYTVAEIKHAKIQQSKYSREMMIKDTTNSYTPVQLSET